MSRGWGSQGLCGFSVPGSRGLKTQGAGKVLKFQVASGWGA